MQQIQKVLVAGATGYLGRFVVQEFQKRGYWVRVLARNPEKLQVPGPYLEPAVDHLADEVFVGEVTKPETLQGICDGIELVFSSIGITRQRDGVSFMDVDYQGNKNLLDGAVQAGVRKFIFISVFQADKIADLAKPRELFVHELKQSGLAYGVIRPTGYFSDMSEYLKMARSGKVYVLGTGQNRINPIHGSDLAKICVDCAENSQKQVEIDVGGPVAYSYEEIATLAFDVIKEKKKISRIPLWLMKMGVRLIRPFSRHGYQVAKFFTIVMGNDFIAPKHGSQSLADYFKELSSSPSNL